MISSRGLAAVAAAWLVRLGLVVTCWAAAAPAVLAACPGCCSSHGGISQSCSSSGRVYCADGSVSPSCLCSTCGVSSTPGTTTAPSCLLIASPTKITAGATSQLTASCSPAPTSYLWTGVGFSSTASSGTVQPNATTTYGVRGTNAGGTGALASATVTVTAATPTCSGGTAWNGTACVCPVGQVSAEGQCYTPAPAAACGVERWGVKTAADSDVAVVNFGAAIPTTVATLQGLAKPASLPQAGRLAPVERSVYALDATLTLYRMTEDSDYHLVVADTSGRTMIVELPHPDCVASTSPVRAQIAAARDAFNVALRATSTFKTVSVPVRIHGVGFMDSVHGQTGVAPNGVELHPVLNIEFSPKTAQAADPAFRLVSDSDRLFNWAEQVYPQFFSGAWVAGVYNEFTYRYYAATGNYVATSNTGRVVVHNGRDWVLLDVGALSAFMPGVAAAGF